MIKDLDINPRNWTKEDGKRVREYCREQGGFAVLFPPQAEDETETCAMLLSDGKLLVWFAHAEMEHIWTFKP